MSQKETGIPDIPESLGVLTESAKIPFDLRGLSTVEVSGAVKRLYTLMEGSLKPSEVESSSPMKYRLDALKWAKAARILLQKQGFRLPKRPRGIPSARRIQEIWEASLISGSEEWERDIKARSYFEKGLGCENPRKEYQSGENAAPWLLDDSYYDQAGIRMIVMRREGAKSWFRETGGRFYRRHRNINKDLVEVEMFQFRGGTRKPMLREQNGRLTLYVGDQYLRPLKHPTEPRNINWVEARDGLKTQYSLTTSRMLYALKSERSKLEPSWIRTTKNGEKVAFGFEFKRGKFAILMATWSRWEELGILVREDQSLGSNLSFASFAELEDTRGKDFRDKIRKALETFVLHGRQEQFRRLVAVKRWGYLFWTARNLSK